MRIIIIYKNMEIYQLLKMSSVRMLHRNYTFRIIYYTKWGYIKGKQNVLSTDKKWNCVYLTGNETSYKSK